MMKLFDFFEEDVMAKRNCFWMIKHTWNPHKEEYVAQLNGNCVIINNQPPVLRTERETFMKEYNLGRSFKKETVYEKISEYFYRIHGGDCENPKTWTNALRRMLAWDAMGEMMRFLPHAKL